MRSRSARSTRPGKSASAPGSFSTLESARATRPDNPSAHLPPLPLRAGPRQHDFRRFCVLSSTAFSASKETGCGPPIKNACLFSWVMEKEKCRLSRQEPFMKRWRLRLFLMFVLLGGCPRNSSPQPAPDAAVDVPDADGDAWDEDGWKDVEYPDFQDVGETYAHIAEYSPASGSYHRGRFPISSSFSTCRWIRIPAIAA